MMDDISKEQFVKALKELDVVRIQVETYDNSFETVTDPIQHPRRYRFVLIMEVQQ